MLVVTFGFKMILLENRPKFYGMRNLFSNDSRDWTSDENENENKSSDLLYRLPFEPYNDCVKAPDPTGKKVYHER